MELNAVPSVVGIPSAWLWLSITVDMTSPKTEITVRTVQKNVHACDAPRQPHAALAT